MSNAAHRVRVTGSWAAILAAVATSGSARPPATGSLLVSVADIPLGGRTTRFDYESIDPKRHLLFVAHLGDSAVVVFDTQERRVVARVEGVAQVHGVLVIPELGRVYASATGSNEVVAIEEATLTITARVPGGTYPDGMAYAPEAHKLYVSDEHGGTDTVIDVGRNVRVGTIPLGGDVGNTQYDPVTKHIFVNVQTLGQLVEIDPVTDEVVGRTSLPGAQGNHGLLIEPRLREAYVACEGNHKLLVVDLHTRKVTASFDVGEDPDVLAYDAVLGFLYVAAESGPVSVLRTGEQSVQKLGDITVRPNGHVVAADSATHLTYFPLENLGGRTVLRIMRPES